jgi:hypothetical protein
LCLTFQAFGESTGLVIIGFGRERTVTCKSCGADTQSKFAAEIAIHFSELKSLEKPIVWVFPQISVCLNCGNAEFGVPEAELRMLEANATAAG